MTLPIRNLFFFGGVSNLIFPFSYFTVLRKGCQESAMTYSEALDEHGISLGPKSTEDVLSDHSSDSWTHTLSFVRILSGWVGGSSHL